MSLKARKAHCAPAIGRPCGQGVSGNVKRPGYGTIIVWIVENESGIIPDSFSVRFYKDIFCPSCFRSMKGEFLRNIKNRYQEKKYFGLYLPEYRENINQINTQKDFFCLLSDLRHFTHPQNGCAVRDKFNFFNRRSKRRCIFRGIFTHAVFFFPGDRRHFARYGAGWIFRGKDRRENG